MTTTLPDVSEVLPLIEDAVMAPSMHNAQPWRFVFQPDTGVIELHGDPGRAMPHADPDHRASTWAAPPRCSTCGCPPPGRAGSLPYGCCPTKAPRGSWPQ